MSNEPSLLNLLHLLWVGAATVFWKLWSRVDQKADKDDVDDKHADNIERLKDITTTLDRVEDKVGQISEKVAVLGDRAGLGHGRR